MTAHVRILRLCAVVAFFYVAGHTRRLVGAQLDAVRKAAQTSVGRPYVSMKHAQLNASGKPGRPEHHVDFGMEDHIDEDVLAEAKTQRDGRTQGHTRRSRRGSPEKRSPRSLPSLGAGAAVALIATTALLSWILFARFYGATKEGIVELPAVTALSDVPEAATAEKPEQTTTKKPEKASERIYKAFHALVVASILGLLMAPFVFPEQTAHVVKDIGKLINTHPIETQAAMLLATALYLARKLKLRPKGKEMDWTAAADLFVKQTPPKDRKNLKLRLGQALQLIAGAEEQATRGRDLHVHPLQLRDFRIGAYATSLWLAAAARMARLSLGPEESQALQAEMRKALDLSDALRRLSKVSPSPESLDLQLAPYKRSWMGRLKLPRVKRDDLTNLGSLIWKIYRKLPA